MPCSLVAGLGTLGISWFGSVEMPPGPAQTPDLKLSTTSRMDPSTRASQPATVLPADRAESSTCSPLWPKFATALTAASRSSSAMPAGPIPANLNRVVDGPGTLSKVRLSSRHQQNSRSTPWKCFFKVGMRTTPGPRYYSSDGNMQASNRPTFPSMLGNTTNLTRRPHTSHSAT